MSKYIVDTDDFEHLFKVDSIGVMGIGKSLSDEEKDHSWSRFKDVGEFEELTAEYVNDLQDTAYQKGYKDCETRYCSFDACPNRQAEYQRGLDDAWEAARNISMLESDGGYSWEEMKSIFGTDSASEIYVRHTAAEAINKIKAYEEKQNDEIEVGDEVKPFYTDITGMVTLVDGDTIYVLWRDGSSTSTLKLKEVRKTGRQFDIASILEDMRND